MKKLLLLFACLFFTAGLIKAQTITVSSPNGGETWSGCSSQTITWSHSGTSGFFNVDYSTNNGSTWASLATNYSGTSIAWNPIPNISTSQALVRVVDFSSSSVRDSSNSTFTITPALIVTSPNGGEQWQVANPNTQTITWNGFGTSNSFLLEYSTNGGSGWNTITSATFTPSGNSYSYTWTIPNNPSAFCLVRVTDNGSPSCKKDASDGVFEIIAPTPVINVTSPNGGNTLYIGQSHTITWTSAYLSGSFVKIEYSTDNGSNWTTVINSTNNTGSYSWTNIPNTPGNTCLVKISDAGNPSTFDVSDAVFTIALGTITVTYPNGGETLNGCQAYSITWTRTGTSNYFNIDYSTNNGSSWSSIATNYFQSGGTGSFSWTVPNVSSSQALVRVRDFNNSAIVDSSNAMFTINPALVVTAPDGGETWQGGTSQTITWTQGPGASNYWTIQYSTDGGNNWTNIINNVYITTSQYIWNPVANIPSSNCLIRVYDYQNSSCRIDVSNNLFTITPATPVITVTQPNTNLTWYVGGSYTINWTYQYVGGSFVTIEYSTNNGTNWTTIANSTSIGSGGNGSYTWNPVPNTPSNQCLVKVSEYNNLSVKDSSNTVFNIVYPYVTVTAPNGGQSWNGCTAQNITWSYFGTGSPSWRIEYSIDNGTNWNIITSSTTGSSYSWNPLPNTGNYSQSLVKVTRTTDALVVDSSDANFTINKVDYIIVTSPNGGEQWQVNNPASRNITWTYSGTNYYFDIYYSIDSGSNWIQIYNDWYDSNLDGNGVYSWTLPNNPSNKCLVKVVDYSSTCKYDISDAKFEILAPDPVITVTSPNTNLTYYVGGSYNITWTYQYVSTSFVKIEYSTDNGSNWTTIANSTSIGSGGSGSYTWNPVPNTPSNQCLVRVSEFGNPTVNDVSNTTFNIVYPYVVVTSPNTSVTWNGCTNQSITWNYYGTGSSTWKIEYSTDNGANWNTITSSASGSSYTWNPVPNTATYNQSLIKVTKNTDALVTDSSDVNFTINKVTYVIVNTPNGGEQWEVNNPSTQQITWSYSGTSYYFDIYYSVDSGLNWIQIYNDWYDSNLDGNGVYNWTIPNNPSNKCLVKVVDYSATCKYDISDAVFEIKEPTPVITVNSPNTNLTYYVGGSYNITWSYQYVTGSFVQIDYSINNGSTWLPIAASTSISTGSYTWNPVPNTPSNQCLVRVRSTADTTVSDVSNTTFNIVYPYVVVTSPNGGQSWNGCTNQSITWNYYGTGSTTWKIEYSTDNGVNWNTITSSASGSSYTWNPVPNTATFNQSLIKVTKNTDALVTDSSDATFTINRVEYIVVTSPNGGEQWQVNNPATRNITWTYSGTNYYFDIYYSVDSGLNWIQIYNDWYDSNLDGLGTYTWNLPNNPSTKCLVKVVDYANTCKYDVSDAKFEIVAPDPVITVTSPNTNLTYYVGTAYNITWTSAYLTSTFVKIEYSIDNGSSWLPVFNSTANDGTESWTVPNTPSNQCLVKVSEYGNPSVYDVSNTTFNIVYPYVTVNQPNGSENINGCSSYSIQWSGFGAGSGPWKVEYSIDSGATWTILTSGTSSSSFTWNPVPNTPSTKSLVRVTKTTDALVTDNSNATFNITQNTSVIVTSPNGGEQWQVANPSTRNITWTYSGTNYYFDIYYSVDSGLNWIQIYNDWYDSNLDGIGTYTWTIPNNPSTKCLVKVVDYNNTCKFDISDAVFEIVAPTPVITVTQPNTNLTWYVGTAYSINWTSQYLTSNFVKIEYSTDNGGNWTTIFNATSNDNTESWTVPNTPSNQCLVRVSEYGNPSVNDVSNTTFNIVSPYITVNQPNGAENINGCTSYSISWTGYGLGTGPYKVEYTTDNGSNWTTLISSTTSSSYTWNPVPNISSTQTRVRVSLVSNSTVNDESNANFNLNPQVYIIVNTPNGGEQWQVGNPSSQTINWAFAGTSNYFDIYASYNGGSSWTLIGNDIYATGGNGNFNWTVSNNPSNNCLIKIQDYSSSCKYDVSDASFTILAPTPYITVTNPNGGNTLYSFNNYSITWTSAYLSSSNVKIEYSADSGATWIVIASSVNNTGSYSWAVPNISTVNALVRVTDAGNSATNDISNAVFTIKPAVVVSAPNGGENLNSCTVTSITWTGEPGTNSYALQYSLNGGSSWTTIVSQSFSGGPNYSYNWTLPNVSSNFCLVKITNNSNTNKVDQSDAVFSIVPSIIVTNPNNGGSYAVGSTLNITWTSQGVSDYYNIEYSTNGGGNWNTIVFNQYITTNSYSWTVPNAPSTNCYIRVTDNNSSCKQDQSDLAFTIAASSPSITVTSPNGGENWVVCTTHNITWSFNGTSGNYDIEYSINNGGAWISIVTNYASSNGVYSWTLPSTTTTQGLVRIKDSGNGTLIDQSNTAFTISNLATPGAITGNTAACEGSTQTYSISLVTGATSYTWTLPSGWSGTSTSNTINVVVGNTSGSVSVTANNSCGSSAAASKSVTITPLPATPGSVSGNSTPCTGVVETYTISAVSGATSYTWILPSGYSGTSSTTSINVTTGSSTGTIYVSANNSCGSGASSSLAVIPSGALPEKPLSISGNTSACVGSVQAYSIPAVSGATSYTWTLPSGWTGTSTTTSISATVGTTGGTISVAANNSCGSSPAQTLAVGVSNVPAQPGTITGNTPVCLNSTNTYSISSVSGATSYTWTLPSGWTGSSNSTSIATVAAGGSGNVEVTANNTCGSSAPRTLSVVVNNPSTPSVSISTTASGTICANTSVTFTASPSNGGTPAYQWFKNSVAVGTNSAIYSATGWNNNDSVWVIMTSSLTCVTTSSATSNKIGLSVTPNVTPTISIAADNVSVCAGQTVIFTSTTTNGGGAPGYQWRKNGINISGATSAAYSTNSIVNGDAFTCVLTSNAQCASPSTATSNSVVVSVTSNVTPSITISAAPSGAICTGESVTFSSTINNGGSAPTYDWTVNGLSAGSGNTFITSSLNNGDTVRCSLTSDLTCVTSATVNSNSIIQTVNPYVDPLVSISADNNPICIGQNVTFTATPTYGGSSPAYQWRKNGVNIGGATSSTYSTSVLNDEDTIDVILTSNYACLNTSTTSSNEIIISVTSSVTPDVTIAVSPDSVICAGTNVTFTATPLNGGSTPTYQWRKNGVNIGGATSSTYSSTTLITNDAINVVMTSSAGCASPTTDTSDAITMTVNPNVTASVNISADMSSPVCAGASVTFTASPTNGGITPAYQWRINGVDVSGETSVTYSTSTLANGNAVTVQMTSGAQCATPLPATSNTLTYTVNSLPPTPIISANGATAFCDGGNVTLTSSSSTGNLWSSGETTQSVNVISSGTFTVTVTDGNNCSSSSSSTIVTVNENPTVTVSHNDVSCNGDTDGDVTANASDGTAPYSYLWSNAEITASVTGLSAGTYTVTVTDDNSCTATASATIATATSIVVADSMEFCKTQTPMAVLLGSPAGGVWTGSSGVIITGDDSLDVENTPWTLGVPHTLTYSFNGCSEDVVLTITGSNAGNDTVVCINDGVFNLQTPLPAGGTWSSIGSGGIVDAATGEINPAGLSGDVQYIYTHTGCPDTMLVTYREVTLATSSTNESCNPGNDGIVSVSASGGTNPYSYNWSSGGTASSETGLAAGTYDVTVSDNGGCSESASITITKDAAPDITVSQDSISICNGDSVMISASGADSYSWNPSANLSAANIANPVASPTSGIIYIVTGTVSGCSDVDSVVITVNSLPSTPVITSGGSNNLCPGDTIILTSSSGSGNVWSPNGETTNSIAVSTQGSYAVTVTDGNNCSATSLAVAITQSSVPSITAGGATDFCAGGSVTLTSSSATGNTWSPDAETTQSITVDSTGNYFVTVDDGSCIVNSNTIAVTVYSLPSPTISADGATTFCAGGSVTLTSSALSGNSWNPDGETTQAIVVTTSDNYSVTETDGNGCVGTSNSISVTVDPAPSTPTISASGPTTFCSGDSVILTSSSATDNVWSPNGETTQSITVSATNSYSVTVTDGNGCSATSAATNVTVNSTPSTPTISAGGPTTFCSGGSVTLTSSSPTGNTWSGGQTTQSVIITAAGSYTVTVNNGGCSATSAATSVTVNPSPTAFAGNDVTITQGNSTQLNATGGVSYSWSPITGLTDPNIPNPVASPTATTPYVVTVTAANGCTATDTVVVTVNPPLNYCSPQYSTTAGQGTDDGDFIDGVVLGTINNTNSGAQGGPTYNNYTNLSTNLTKGLSYTINITSGVYTADDYAAWIDYNQDGDFADAGEMLGQFTTNVAFQTMTINFTVPAGALNGNTRLRVRCAWFSTPATMDPCTLYGYGEAEDYTVSIIPNCGTITVNTTPTNATCGNSNGSATATASGGATPYSYLWSNGQSGATATGLAAGNYTVTATDANTCTGTGSVTISGTSSPSATASSTNVSCNGGNNGTATASASGGTTPYSYSWSSGGTSATITGLITGTYSVTVTDNSGCTATASATVTEPSSLIVGMMQTDVSCFGGNNGDAMAMPSGGTSPYSYLWDDGQTGQTATGLVAGTYSVTVTDDNGCTISGSATITEPASAVSANISSSVNASCNGSSDGSATADASGGVSPYTFIWSNGQSGTTATGLSAGTYMVTASDANSCSTTASITITEPAGMTLTTSATLANCNASDGSATVNASGGETPYSYLWDNGQTTSTATGLPKATYSVTVTDANLCSKDTSVFVEEVGGLTASISSFNNVSCLGGNDGSAVAIATAGTSPYSFLWNDVASTANDTVTGLIAGTYLITITDDVGCTDVASVTIAQPSSAVSVNISSSTDVSCFGGNDGSATASASGGTSPYTYLWSTLSGFETLTGLVAGTYSVTATDANGCTTTASVTITEPSSAVSVSITSSTDVSCFSGNNGNATADATGGTSGYSYSWSNGASGATASGLIAGTYTVTATDANGCTSTASATITEPSSAVSVNISGSTNVSCFNGNNGSATADATGGTSGYTYSWSNGTNGATASGLIAGTYTVTATDANSCTATASVTITEPASALSASATSTGVNCFGNTNGSATVTAAGGTTSYTYLWSNGGTTATISGLTGGTYTVTVTDFNGCTATASATVSSPSSALSVSISSQVNVTCFGLCNGSATPNASGGTSPYSYTWSNGGNGTNLCANSYTVTVTDINGCTDSVSITITQPSSSASVSISSQTDVSCNGESNGSATASATGGASGFTYSWSNGTGGATASGLNAGTYTVTATDINGCSANTSVVITQPAAIVPNSSSTAATCSASNGSASVNPSGGNSPYDYNWINGGTTATISNIAAGTYNFTVTDANGCDTTGSVIVANAGAPTVTISSTNVSCFGGNNGFATANATGGTTPLTYFWNTTPPQTTPMATGLAAGTYSVVVTDTNLCSTQQNVTIAEPALMVISVTKNDDTQGAPNCNGSATATVSTGGVPPYTYTWSNGQVTATATGLCAGIYTVTVKDANQCQKSLDITILSSVGIEEYNDAVKVNIFPNPNKGMFELFVETNQLSKGSVIIYNIIGEEISRTPVTDFSIPIPIDITMHGNGMYFVQIISENGTLNRKVLVE